MNVSQLRRRSRKQLRVLAEAAGAPTAGLRTKTDIIEAILAASAHEAGKPESEELPTSYGCTRLVLMDVEPRLVHAYWEITPGDFKAAMARMEPADAPALWVLRFYDVTSIVFDGTNAHGHFDVPVDLAPGNWYVRLWEGEKTYFAEIGPCGPDGKFLHVCRSNFVQVPRDRPASGSVSRWLKIAEGSGRQEIVEGLPAELAAEQDGSARAQSLFPTRSEVWGDTAPKTDLPGVPGKSEAAGPAEDESTAAPLQSVPAGSCAYFPDGGAAIPPERTTEVGRDALFARGASTVKEK